MTMSVLDRPVPANLDNLAPGTLVDAEDITAPGDPTFPAGARAWRLRYVSTGRDNLHRTLVAGIVVAPVDLDRLAVVGDRGRIVSWTHGTLGMVQRCQPSVQPEVEIWGQTPFGINQVAWGSEERGDRREGRPEDGILAGMIEHGWIVTATDYASESFGNGALQPYVLGKIEAANAIDMMRAAHHLLSEAFDGWPVSAYDVVTWGHSQGGHAAMWTGQLLEEYDAATREGDGPTFFLSGVALEAPGSNFLVDPSLQGEDALGTGMLDWLAHTTIQLTGQPEPIPLAPFIMSYLAGSWTSHASGGTPDPDQMPAFPVEGDLDLRALVSASGLDTVSRMTQACWADGDLVADLARPFSRTPFLVPELNDGPIIDGVQHGNFDRYLNSADVTPELATWRDWLRYNIPGPRGVHPYSKVPMRDGAPVPVLITNGSNDGVVHCVAADHERLPTAKEGVAVDLFAALREVYEQDGDLAAYLALVVWKPQAEVTVADHSDVTGLIAAAALDDPRFHGSPLEQFIVGAFEGSLPREVTARFGNP